jgi:flavin reductase (DIM6/NTAB) family NADH-FMN oxidoreductase RutF
VSEPAPRSIGADALRAVMRRFPTGVTIVATMFDGQPKGFTATAVASVSLDPPLVLVCVNRGGRSHPVISAAGHFCVNFLRREQEALARAFAQRNEDDPFAGLAIHTERTGSPVIDGSLAFLDCLLEREHPAGTHAIFIGRVVASGASAGEPLGYVDGNYADFGTSIA